MEKTLYYYNFIETSFGQAAAVLRRESDRLLVSRIILPGMIKRRGTETILKMYPGAVMSPGICGAVCTRISDFLCGDAVAFDFSELDIGVVHGFRRRILTAAFGIPRGFVMTYGGLAASVNAPGGARAAGNALAGNPFPLIIPCHRVIKGDRSLGGFGGGVHLKRSLLELEGVSFDAKARVLPVHILS